MTLQAFQEMMDMHLMGAVKPIKAVWGGNVQTSLRPHHRDHVDLWDYLAIWAIRTMARAKMGVVGLMNTLKLEGAPLRYSCQYP